MLRKLSTGMLAALILEPLVQGDGAGMGNIRIYDVHHDFKLVNTIPVFRQEYFHFYVDDDADATYVVSGHEDGSLRLWRYSTE